MNEGIKKFEELLKTDEAFQKKLADAAQAYNGEMTEEAIFNNVLVPIASEYGITATIDEATCRLRGDTTHLVQIEHEDALMTPFEGLRKAISVMDGVIIKETATDMWWA